MRTVAVAVALLTALAAPASAEDQLRKALESDITISFARTPLGEVLGAVREIAQLNVVIDPAINDRAMLVTAESSGGTVDAFLRGIEKDHALSRSVWCGVLYLHTRDTEPGPEPTQGSEVEGLKRRISVNFVRATMIEAMERFKGRTGVDFYISSRVRRYLDREVGRFDLRLWSVEARHVLTHLCQASGLIWSLKDGKVEFDVSQDRPAGDAGSDQVEVAADPNLENLDPQAEDVDQLVADLAHAGKRRMAIKRLVRVGKSAGAAVAESLQGEDDDAVIAGLQVLAELGGEDHVGAVLKVFRDSKRALEVRTEAGNTLGALGGTEAIPYLIEALGDTWFKVSETARSALVQLGEPAVEPLRRRYAQELRKSDGSDGIIYRALLIFGQIGGDDAVGVLKRAIKARKGRRAIALRHHAAIGLGFSGRKDVIKTLIDALEAEPGGGLVRKYINRSLNWITQANLPPQVSQWKIWWSRNHEKLGLSEEQFEPLAPDWGDLPDLDGDDQ
jgi:hypothetical protein